jgi:hypothetical protein
MAVAEATMTDVVTEEKGTTKTLRYLWSHFLVAAFRWNYDRLRGTRLAAPNIVTMLSPRNKQQVNKQ